jgi:hypothetical protein
MNYFRIILFVFLVFTISQVIHAQSRIEFDPSRNCYVDASTKECLPNTIMTSLPFLTIVPDARGAALGDAGIAISPDASAMHFNAAKIAMSDKDFEISTTYTPWLKNLGLNDIYLAYLSGYNKIDKLQGVGYSIRYFSMGEIQFTNEDRQNIGVGNPSEFEVAAAYARKLSDNFSAALTGKFIYSNLAAGQRVDGILISAATAFAADLSMFYKRDVTIGGYNSKLNIGLAITNLGNKITYTKDAEVKEYLPQNIGLGAALEIPFDDYNTITITADINKLLLPTPVIDTVPKIRNLESPINAALKSFSDAPGGFQEEMRELALSFGLEYWYDKQFAIRAGYFYEHPLKGDRQYLTLGLGLKYNIYSMGLSYLVPTNATRHPLDGTLRFSFAMDFTKGKM